VKNRIFVAASLGIGLVAVLSLVHPFGTVKGRWSPQPLFAGVQADPAVLRIVGKSCQSCHSDRTEWPWYSYVAPLSWMIESDVHQGRSHMNLSHWDEYSPEKQSELLTRIAAAVRSRQMPLPRYLQVHPDARLSDADVDLLYQWARSERKRVKTVPPVTTGGVLWTTVIPAD
jgi:hypothetical protein